MQQLFQKTHGEIVEDKKLHLVEMCKENGYFPNVLASPSTLRSSQDLKNDEVLDFTQYSLDGRVILKRKKFPPFYTKHKSWEIYLKKQESVRNQDLVRRYMIKEYGEIRSFLADKYPECRPQRVPPKKKEEEA